MHAEKYMFHLNPHFIVLWSYRFLKMRVVFFGRIAQPVRAPALQAGGHRFEPCSAYHINS